MRRTGMGFRGRENNGLCRSRSFLLSGFVIGAVVGLGTLCPLAIAAPHEAGKLPSDLDALIKKDPNDAQAIQSMIYKKLNEHLCDPMPDLKVVDRKGKTVSLRQKFRGKRVAIFLAAADTTYSVRWCEELESSSWKAPEGYAALVTLIITPEMGKLTKCLITKPDVFLSDFPLEGYLSYAYVYPLMFYMSADGDFEGYQKHGDQITKGGCHEDRKH